MSKFTLHDRTQGGNPLVTVLLFIVTAIVIGVSIVLGFFAFLALSTLAIVSAIVVAVRHWWAKRQSPKGEVIEGEFHVVKRPKNS